MKKIWKDDHGLALVVALMLTVILLLLVGGGMLFSGINLRTTSHLQTGNKALHAADGGIQHALATLPLVYNTFPYATQTTVLNNFSFGVGGYSYTVKVKNDPASPGGNTRAILTSTALGPDGARKVVTAYIVPGPFGLGAINLPESPAASTETNFSGTSFIIDGNDYCHAAPPVPGISVNDPALADEIVNHTLDDGGLSTSQMPLVTGVAGSPSVSTAPPLSSTVEQLADAYLNLNPGYTPVSGGTQAGNAYWGNSHHPEITLVQGDVKITGTISGYGVLIVDGNLEIAGNFDFHGLVIAKGDIEVQVDGDAAIYGSLILGGSTTQDAGYELDIRGNAAVRYDSCALAAANSWFPTPKAAKIAAWRENF